MANERETGDDFFLGIRVGLAVGLILGAALFGIVDAAIK